MGERISIVLIECLIHVIRIEIPKIARRQLQLIGFALYLAEQEDMAVTLLDRPLIWVKEVLDRWVVFRQEIIVQIKNTGSAHNISSSDFCKRAIFARRSIADKNANGPALLDDDLVHRCIAEYLATKVSEHR